MGQRKTKRRTRIGEQFAPRVISMLRSPACRVLSLSEHRCLARLEIELADQGGADNGKLPCTYDDFERYGVHRKSIGPSLRAVVALGFVEITERGRAGNAEWRRPTVFRLTYRATAYAGERNEWQRIKTVEQAEKVARAAREGPAKKQNPSGGKRTEVRCGKRTSNGRIHSAETAPTLDISGRGQLKTNGTSGDAESRGDAGDRGQDRRWTELRPFEVVHGGTVTRSGVRSVRKWRAS